MAKFVFLVLAALCYVSLALATAQDDTDDSEEKITIDREAFKDALNDPKFRKILKSLPSRKRRNIITGVAFKTALCVGKEVVKDTAKGAWNKITGNKEEESIQNRVLKQIPGGKMAYRTSKCAGQAVADTAKDVAKTELTDLKNKVDSQIDAAKKALDDPLAAADDVTKRAKSAIIQQVDLTKNVVTNPIGTLQDTVKSANDRVVATKDKVMAPVNAVLSVAKLMS